MTYSFDKSKVALELLQHRGSKLKLIHLERDHYFFFDFQPVTLPMSFGEYYDKATLVMINQVFVRINYFLNFAELVKSYLIEKV